MFETHGIRQILSLCERHLVKFSPIFDAIALRLELNAGLRVSPPVIYPTVTAWPEKVRMLSVLFIVNHIVIVFNSVKNCPKSCAKFQIRCSVCSS